jgi:hypothetical protein
VHLRQVLRARPSQPWDSPEAISRTFWRTPPNSFLILAFVIRTALFVRGK